MKEWNALPGMGIDEDGMIILLFFLFFNFLFFPQADPLEMALLDIAATTHSTRWPKFHDVDASIAQSPKLHSVVGVIPVQWKKRVVELSFNLSTNQHRALKLHLVEYSDERLIKWNPYVQW